MTADDVVGFLEPLLPEGWFIHHTTRLPGKRNRSGITWPDIEVWGRKKTSDKEIAFIGFLTIGNADQQKIAGFPVVSVASQQDVHELVAKWVAA